MRTPLLPLAVALCLGLSCDLAAKNLRWASPGDTSTLDPQAQNETFTNGTNGLTYEYLVTYDNHLELPPALAASWPNTCPTTLVFQLRRDTKRHAGSPFGAGAGAFS